MKFLTFFCVCNFCTSGSGSVRIQDPDLLTWLNPDSIYIDPNLNSSNALDFLPHQLISWTRNFSWSESLEKLTKSQLNLLWNFQFSGSGIQCLFDPLDPGSGMGKKSGSGSGMNNPDHISESLETIFWVLKHVILWCGSGIRDGKKSDPGSGMEKFRIRYPGWKKFGSGIWDGKILDPE